MSRLSTLLFVSLSLSSCATKPLVIDSFCQLYEPLIQEKGDSAITAKLSVKKRILGNETIYRDQCK